MDHTVKVKITFNCLLLSFLLIDISLLKNNKRERERKKRGGEGTKLNYYVTFSTMELLKCVKNMIISFPFSTSKCAHFVFIAHAISYQLRENMKYQDVVAKIRRKLSFLRDLQQFI